MAILIDGYNLLHVTGVFADSVGPGALERLHQAFVQFLAEALDPEERKQTTVVLDAKGKRAATRRTVQMGDITVRYASRHEDADHLLAELIAQHTAPRHLIVVSSDRQVQRAARRRRAKVVRSQEWHAELLRRLHRRRHPTRQHPPEAKPAALLSADETARWLAHFGLPPAVPQDESELPASAVAAGSAPGSQPGKKSEPVPNPHDRSLLNPFPRDYLEAIEGEIRDNESRIAAPKSSLAGSHRRPRRSGPRRNG